MSAQNTFHAHLLRPAIIHILRAQGFHSTRPSVLDTITDLAARYISLLAQRTAYFVYDRTTTPLDTTNSGLPTTSCLQNIDAAIPTIPDIRQALSSASVFNNTTTASEEVWAELLRKPLSALPAAAQDKERRRRDEEDTVDVQDFLDWITGAANAEIMRIAGLQDESGVVAATANAAVTAVTAGTSAAGAAGAASKTAAVEDAEDRKEDYLSLLRKKRSKTGEGSRFAGTALGKVEEERGGIKIEGGPESLGAWAVGQRKRRLEVDVNGEDGVVV